MKNAFLHWKLAKDPCASFIRTDGILLDVRNRKERCCVWSLGATTSHIRALSLPFLQDLMNVRLFPCCCKFSLDSPKYCFNIIHFPPNVLPGPCLSSSPIVVASWVPSCVLPGALIALVSCQGRSNTKIVVSISVACQYDLTCDFMYPSCSIIQENIIFDSTNDQSNLEFEKVLDIGIWENPFPFQASSWVARPRISSNEAQHEQSHEAQSDSTRCYVAHAWKEKWHGWSRSSPPFNCPDILQATRSMHLSSFVVPSPS
jgi:hypothetical protein